MFCYKCGREINEGAAFCPGCGASQGNRTADNSNYSNQNYSEPNYGNANYNNPNYSAPNCGNVNGQYIPKANARCNTLSIIGLVVSCVALLLFNGYGLVGLAGMIVSIIALNECKKSGEEGRAFAIIGIVLGGISLLAGIFSLVILLGVLNGGWFDIFFDMMDELGSAI